MRMEQAPWKESLAITGETSLEADWSEAISRLERKVSKGRSHEKSSRESSVEGAHEEITRKSSMKGAQGMVGRLAWDIPKKSQVTEEKISSEKQWSVARGRQEAVSSVGQGVKADRYIGSCRQLEEEGRIPRNFCVRIRLLWAVFVCEWWKSGVSRR